MKSRTRPCVAALSLAGLATLGLAAPAAAQESQPGNPGQGSERCEAAGAPGSGAYPPAAGTQDAAVSDSTPQRGQRVTATSGCREFAPGASVSVRVGSLLVGSTVASAQGEAVTSFIVPTTLADGGYEVLFSGLGFSGQPHVVGVPIQVAGGTSGAATGGGTPEEPADTAVGGADDGAGTVTVAGVSLPRTGSGEVVPLTATGFGLVAAGGALVLVARRRRQDQLPTA